MITSLLLLAVIVLYFVDWAEKYERRWKREFRRRREELKRIGDKEEVRK